MRMSPEYYHLLETGLRGLLAAVSTSLLPRRAQEVEEFIDSSEFGVALTWLAEALKEAHTPVSSDIENSIQELAELMGIAADIPPFG